MSINGTGACFSLGTGFWCKGTVKPGDKEVQVGSASGTSTHFPQECNTPGDPAAGILLPLKRLMRWFNSKGEAYHQNFEFICINEVCDQLFISVVLCGYPNILNEISSLESVLLKDLHSVPSSGFHRVIRTVLHQKQIAKVCI